MRRKVIKTMFASAIGLVFSSFLTDRSKKQSLEFAVSNNPRENANNIFNKLSLIAITDTISQFKAAGLLSAASIEKCNAEVELLRVSFVNDMMASFTASEIKSVAMQLESPESLKLTRFFSKTFLKKERQIYNMINTMAASEKENFNV